MLGNTALATKLYFFKLLAKKQNHSKRKNKTKEKLMGFCEMTAEDGHSYLISQDLTSCMICKHCV